MDFTMASTKRWTDNCMGWTPLHSMIYISQLFMIQTLRSMESSGSFPPSSEYATLLNGIRLNFRLENFWIPGPLVQFFKNLACFWPSATESHGPVTPALPAIPTWDRATKYALSSPFNRYLPNIAAMISRLRTICTTSDRDGMTEALFVSDVNGPRYCASLFGQALADGEFDRLHMTSPGIGLSLPGNLRLWQNASAVLNFSGLPAAYDSDVDEVLPSWGMYMNLYNVVDWFGPVTAMMSKYCQFWKGSVPLSDCAPNCSAAGAVKCEPLAATDMFAQPTWVAQASTHNHNSHGNGNQIGHYTLHSSRTLTISARSTLVDVPDSMYFAAITYCFNCRIEDVQGVRAGQFWAIAPDLIGRQEISTLPGVLTSIVRDYHNETKLDASRN
ncbi:capsid protein [Phtheirospermum japonicum]|uniref:Capsid protein n=1 Tax=Phtheirospermum japonicum TaxID=374723 RepID=A0A830B8H2_9LAMI|nr:capsid protein [Phtheirospermum japonicum]